MRTILIKLAYLFLPSLYKKRFFKSLDSLKKNVFACEPELLYLKNILKEDSVFIDVGTNNGIYLYQAEKIIKTGKIIGFEPNTQLVAFASKLFKNIKINQVAISSKSGVSTFYVPKKDGKYIHTRGSLEEIKENAEKVEVPTISLDEWVEINHLDKIDVIKIDIEGHELAAIQGCKQVLAVFHPILIIEIELRHANYPISAIFELIRSFDYEVFYFDRQTKNPVLFNEANIADFQEIKYANDLNKYINNFIFIPK